MLGCFPNIEPDELLYSAWSRYTVRLGMKNVRALSRLMFHEQVLRPAVDLPTHLDTFADVLASSHSQVGEGLTSDQLIDRHTMLPLYASFLPANRVQTLRATMKGDRGGAIHNRSGIMAWRVEEPGYFRVCLDCVAHDRASLGETYWRRTHQAAGVFVCPQHGTALYETRVPIRNRRHSMCYISAEEALDARPPTAVELPCNRHDILVRIARNVQRLLTLDIAPYTFEQSTLSERYHDLLRRRGLAVGDRVRMTDLKAQFSSYFSPEFLDVLGCRIESDGEWTWFNSVLRRDRKPQHPLQHLLFAEFLGCTLDELFAKPTESTPPPPFGSPPWLCLNPACQNFRRPVVERCSVEFVGIGNGRRARGIFGCACGFEYILYEGADLGSPMPAGCSVPPRYHLRLVNSYGPVWEQRLRDLWDAQAMALGKMAKILEVSSKTLKRQAVRIGLSLPEGISSHNVALAGGKLKKRTPSPEQIEQYRKRWAEALAGEPGRNGTYVRSQEPAVWSWLNRHDRAWLRQNSPRAKGRLEAPHRSPVDWVHRDAILSREVLESAERIRLKNGRPTQVTLTAIGHDLHQDSMLGKHIHRLPLTANAVQSVIESRDSFALRRIEWAVQELEAEGKPLKRWTIMKAAGLERMMDNPVVIDALAACVCRLEE